MSHCRSLPRSRWPLAFLVRPSSTASIITSTSFLPFLYQTRSISYRVRSDTDEIPFIPPHREDPFAYLYSPDESAPRKPASNTRPAPANLSISQHPRDDYVSTVTLREREIFAQIFESILSTPTARAKSTPAATSVDAQPRARALPPPPALAELFASTIGPQSHGSNLSFGPQQKVSQREGATAIMALASQFKDYPPSIRLAAARVAGIDPIISASPEDVEYFEELTKKMDGTSSDLELLQLLEESVFSLPANHNNTRVAFYANLLIAAMNVFRDVYNDLGGVIAIFERAKKLGAESYVLGCTTGVYNHMLAAVWDGFADLDRIRDLVEEMRVNAVMGNIDTVNIIRRICDRVKKVYEKDGGELAAMMVGDPEMRMVDVLTESAIQMEMALTEPPPLLIADAFELGGEGSSRSTDSPSSINHSKGNSKRNPGLNKNSNQKPKTVTEFFTDSSKQLNPGRRSERRGRYQYPSSTSSAP